VIEICSEPENRMAFTGDDVFLRTLHLNYRRGVSSFYKTDETFKTIYIGLVTDRLLREKASLIASRLHEAGILSLAVRNQYKLYLPEQTASEIGPQVLTLDQLRAGFIVCSVLLALSLVAFAAEFVPRISMKIFNHFLPAYIVMKYVKSQKKQSDKKCRSQKPKTMKVTKKKVHRWT
jgi:hypothetical protein